jgi:hypothetical protein
MHMLGLFRIHFKHNKNAILFLQKMLRLHRHTHLYVLTMWFQENPIFYVACVKKIKFIAKIGFFCDPFSSFLHMPYKMSVFFLPNFKQSHRMWRSTGKIKISLIFKISFFCTKVNINT